MRRHRSPIPLRALAGVLREDWRVRHRFATQPTRVGVGGVEVKLDDWWATPPIREALYDGSYELAERSVLARTLRPTDRFMELGAGLGIGTTRACQVVGAANVTAYEADPRLAAIAAQTARRNGFEPTIRSEAIGSDDGEIDYYRHRDFWLSGVLPAEDTTPIRVPVRSLAAALGAFRPTYLMVDIEGAETELLAAVALPGELRALCIELHPDVTGLESIARLIVKLLGEGFALDLGQGERWIAFFSRGVR